jgi:signal transduction histidine kinase
MGQRIREFDWAATPLGPLDQWSLALRTTVRILLANRFPMLLWWGPDYIQLYNDSYQPIPGDKHPDLALGKPAKECWAEIWNVISPLIDAPFRGGPATWNEDIELELNRRGFLEESHFTIAYSPVPDESVPSGIGGVLATVNEITEKVIGERRTALLRDLGARVGEARTAEEACGIAARILRAYPKDIPFALLYLVDPSTHGAVLTGTVGVDPGQAISPTAISLEKVDPSTWPLFEASLDREVHVVERSDAPGAAAVVPVPAADARTLAGFLVAGVSPLLRFDRSYRDFLDLVRTRIATAIAHARAFEEERARAEALAEIDRAKTAFFSNVSHEFRTPLTLMLGPLEDVLRHPDGLSEPNRERLELAHRNATRQLKLVNTLLDFSRIEAGRTEAAFEATDLSAYTAEIASVFRSTVENAGMELVVDCPPLAEPVYVDREMWEKVVLNLVSNAFKFTFEGGITVSMRRAGDAVELAVRDTGTGIPEQELPRLFERFHRVKDARGRSYEGSGIGLALVQELVKLHGGRVRVESEVARGSTFVVTIPLGTAHLPPDRINAVRTVPSTGLRGDIYAADASRWSAVGDTQDDDALALTAGEGSGRILLADDNADMRDYVRRLLVQRGYEVEAVADGQAAYAAARARPPDLVLTDVMMPGLDGFGMIHAFRADDALKTIPVILLSARAGEEARVEGLQTGADDYLVKPFSARELLARVEGSIKLQRVRREASAALAESQDRLRQAAKMEAIGRLAGGLAHDFNNQLYALSGFANFVAQEPDLSASARHDLLEIQKAADRMAGLTRQLLAFSRQQVLQPETLDLNDAVRESASMLQRLLGPSIPIELDLAASPVWLKVDRSQLLQVLMNLAINARDAMPQGGELLLKTAIRDQDTQSYSPISGTRVEAGRYGQLTVADSGTGIAARDLPHIFEPFFTTKDVGQGTGLGLATVLGIITQSHGHVWAETGKHGATFTVLLPLSEPPAPAPGKPGTRGSVAPRRARILIVEDEDQVRAIVARTLESFGYLVVQARNGKEALERLDGGQEAVDAVLSDVVMPVMGGIELARRLAASRPSLPIIWMSGYPRDSAFNDGAAREHQAFLQKPVADDVLAKTLEEALSGVKRQ